MRRLLWSAGLAVLLAAATLFGAAPAQADTGGGCGKNTLVGPCISRSGNLIRADFYLNTGPNCTFNRYRMEIIVNWAVRWQSGAPRAFTGTGRYPRSPYTAPISVSVASLPPFNQSAFTRVEIYSCTGAFQYSYPSPILYYRA